MAELERLQRRIDTATDLQSVVRTMKTLSAVGISQYEQAADAATTYLDTVERGLQVALRAAPDLVSARPAPEGPTAIVVVGSDFGLCGAFNEEIVDHASEHISALGIAREDLRVLLLGHRLESQWLATMRPPDAAMALPSSVGLLGETVGHVLRWLDARTRGAASARILIVYQSLGAEERTTPRLVRIAPITGADLRQMAGRPWPSRCLPVAQGDGEMLFRHLVRQLIFIRIYAAAARSRAAEYAARLKAMRAADRNIGDKLASLRQTYRLTRQDAITSELLDVVAGFEASRGGGEAGAA